MNGSYRLGTDRLFKLIGLSLNTFLCGLVKDAVLGVILQFYYILISSGPVRLNIYLFIINNK